MARLSARHWKHPYRSPADILSTTYSLYFIDYFPFSISDHGAYHKQWSYAC